MYGVCVGIGIDVGVGMSFLIFVMLGEVYKVG